MTAGSVWLLSVAVEGARMERAGPALLVALLLLASAIPVLGVTPPGTDAQSARTPVQGISPNTTDVMLLDGMQRSTFARADLVVTGAIAGQTGSVTATFEQYKVQSAYDAATTQAAKRAVLENATTWAKSRTASLMNEERRARTAYAAGDSTAAAYLATLGRLEMEAKAVHSTVTAVDKLDGAVGVRTSIDTVLPDLQTLEGPIRQRLAAAVRGETPAPRTFVGVSPSGVTLSQLEGGIFVHSTVRYDNHDEVVGRMGFDAAESRFATLYPWATNHTQRISMGALGPDVYTKEITYPQGTVLASLDASTNEVFREVQTKRLSVTPADVAQSQTVNNTTVTLSRTYAGGPLRVTAQNATGDPMAANVTVNGTAAGSTGTDGTVWAVSPAGPYTVTVRTAGERLNVTVPAAATER